MNTPLPPPSLADYGKRALRNAGECLQQTTQQQQSLAQQYWQQLNQQADLPGWLSYLQKQQQVQQELSDSWQRVQSKTQQQWQGGWLDLLQSGLRARDSKEAMLGLLSWHSSNMQQWHALGEEWMQLWHEMPIAQAACWQDYLAPPEA